MRLRGGSIALLRFALLGLAVAACAVACHSSSGTPSPSQTRIRLAHNDWLGANVNDAIAKILLEEKLGYTVELVPAGTSDQYPLLANGDLHATLEVWPSGHRDDLTKYIDDEHSIEALGPLGPVARKGFYFPRYLLDQHPELAKWTGYTDPKGAVQVFKTAASGDKGQLLSGDPTWVTYDDDLITNLGLQLTPVYAGTEEAEVAALQTAFETHGAVLMFFWLPHWVFRAYDLAKIELPEYTDACYASAPAHGVACDYPPELLTKIAWSGLRRYAPSAYTLLERLTYSTLAQIEMMGRVRIDGLTVEQAAREWIDANEEQWRTWITP